MIPRLLLLLIALTGSAWAQDATEPSESDWKIHLEFYYLSLPEKAAIELLPELGDENKVNDGWKKVEDLIKAGTAKVVLFQRRTTIHGDALKVTEGQEIRYPSSFDMPEIVRKPAKEQKGDQKKKPEKPAPEESAPVAVAYPILDFVTQLIGTQISVEAQVSPNGARLLLHFTSSRTWMLSWDEFEMGRMLNNEKIVLKQPRISQFSSTSSLALSNGERVFLGWHPVPGKDGEVELSFLRGWTTPRKPPGL
jgi:hypothetical protein